MNFSFLRSVIVQCVFLYEVYAVYQKNVLCIIDKGEPPKCQIVPTISSGRRNNPIESNSIPAHDPYIPRDHSVFYNCTSLQCQPMELYSIIQVTSPHLTLKQCFNLGSDYDCDELRYNHLKSIDKLLFLTENIKKKIFYVVDCLVYNDNRRICHRKTENETHSDLVNTGTVVRPNESNVLSQDEFICEESENREILCDVDAFVPFATGLKVKQTPKLEGDILLKTGGYVVILSKKCIDSWCGYTGTIKPTRRSYYYEPPGGKTYRCYYAKRQQICKVVLTDRYNGREINL